MLAANTRTPTKPHHGSRYPTPVWVRHNNTHTKSNGTHARTEIRHHTRLHPTKVCWKLKSVVEEKKSAQASGETQRERTRARERSKTQKGADSAYATGFATQIFFRKSTDLLKKKETESAWLKPIIINYNKIPLNQNLGKIYPFSSHQPLRPIFITFAVFLYSNNIFRTSTMESCLLTFFSYVLFFISFAKKNQSETKISEYLNYISWNTQISNFRNSGNLKF